MLILLTKLTLTDSSLSQLRCLWKPRGALFWDRFRSCTFRQSPIVVDCRRSSPTVADRRRLSPIVAARRRSETENFAQWRKSSLMPYGLRALKVRVKSWPLNFHWTTILNSRKTVPVDGKQRDIVLVTLIELLYTGAAIMWRGLFRHGIAATI